MGVPKRVGGRIALGLAVAVGPASLVAPTAQAAPAAPAAASFAAAAPSDRTSAREARRVDSVPTPRLGWYRCYTDAQCATVKLPLDYDQPKGATVEVAVVRVKARDQRRRIGSLFLNPGGPGGSGVEIALAARGFLGREVLSRFDIVGFDPRGIGFSDNVRCFRTNGAQAAAYAGMSVPFPVTRRQEDAWIRSTSAVARACSSTGKPLSASMSTAEVARDMDVLRRAVGDRKLTYLGFSYGSILGQYYANMFPDRIRALAIDGVLDPVAWRGTRSTAGRPVTDRLRSADASTRALREILVRCDKAGGQRCRFAPGDPVRNYDLVAQRLKRQPLVMEDPEGGSFTFTYADLVALTLSALYAPEGSAVIANILADLIILTEPPASAASAGSRAVVAKAFVRRLSQVPQRAKPRFDFPYENGFEAFSSVLCTDSLNPRSPETWRAAAAAADRRAKYFGRLWTWQSSQCASSVWTARDEDAFGGPFTRRTIAPVLVVGSYWDPATSYAGAVSAAALLPNSRLLKSDNWGHTAYGTSACVTNAMDAYLLRLALPARTTVCRGDVQPFERSPQEALRSASPGTSAGAARSLPPVVAPLPSRATGG